MATAQSQTAIENTYLDEFTFYEFVSSLFALYNSKDLSKVYTLHFWLGSCLSYGHSCWGAHGKRSSNDRTEPEPQQDRWALFKLIQNEVIQNHI